LSARLAAAVGREPAAVERGREARRAPPLLVVEARALVERPLDFAARAPLALVERLVVPVRVRLGCVIGLFASLSRRWQERLLSNH
jgi:hypothetical protein